MRYLGLFLVVVLGLVLGRATFKLLRGLGVGSKGDFSSSASKQKSIYTDISAPLPPGVVMPRRK